MRTGKRPHLRASLIALTHTELMFVFSSLIILILLGTLDHIDFLEAERERMAEHLGSEPEADLADEAGAVVEENAELARRLELVEQTGAGNRARLVDILKKISTQLEEEPDEDEPLALLLERAAEHMAGLEAELREVEQELAASAGPSGQGAAADADLAAQVRALAEAKRSLEAEVAAVSELAASAGLSADDIGKLREAIVSQQQAAQQQLAQLETEIAALRADVLGFTPCWLNPPRGHYLAFRVAWQPGPDLYRLERVWPNDIPAVARAVAGPLAILRSHPTGWLSKNELLAYAGSVEAARAAHYGTDCRLTASIPKSMGGEQVVFVRDQVHLYPIYR